MSDTGNEGGQQQGTAQENNAEGQPQTFTQADVDRIVKERVQREKAKFADYDDLKAKAEGAKTAEERIAALEQQVTVTQREALRSRIQAKHGISDEDAALFLTGTDEGTLTAQAKRLSEREADRKKRGNVAPKEGGSADSKATAKSNVREFTRNLFGTATD